MLHRALLSDFSETLLKSVAVLVRSVGTSSHEIALRTDVSLKEEWRKRTALRNNRLQRFETVKPKLFFAPDWKLDENENKDEGYPNPLKQYETTPEKWEYYNKVVWPPNFVNPETGLPKRREVYHCKQSVHCSPKKMWRACHLVRRRNVDDALLQLKYSFTAASLLLRDVLLEAKKRAAEEFFVEFPSEMHVAEAFGIQCKIVKSMRRHAHEKWAPLRHRYINIFVRLEEGEGPGLIEDTKKPDGWQLMEEYYDFLRNRSIKYSI